MILGIITSLFELLVMMQLMSLQWHSGAHLRREAPDFPVHLIPGYGPMGLSRGQVCNKKTRSFGKTTSHQWQLSGNESICEMATLMPCHSG